MPLSFGGQQRSGAFDTVWPSATNLVPGHGSLKKSKADSESNVCSCPWKGQACPDQEQPRPPRQRASHSSQHRPMLDAAWWFSAGENLKARFCSCFSAGENLKAGFCPRLAHYRARPDIKQKAGRIRRRIAACAMASSQRHLEWCPPLWQRWMRALLKHLRTRHGRLRWQGSFTSGPPTTAPEAARSASSALPLAAADLAKMPAGSEQLACNRIGPMSAGLSPRAVTCRGSKVLPPDHSGKLTVNFRTAAGAPVASFHLGKLGANSPFHVALLLPWR